MSDTEARDAVLREFAENDEYRVLNPDAMADEIVRLRNAIAAEEANRRATLAHCGLLDEFEHCGCDTLQWVCDALVSERAAIARVRALHFVEPDDQEWCYECNVVMPCPTLRALDGDA